MKAKRQLHAGDIIFEIVLVLFILIFVFVTLYPIINTLAISFNDGFDTVTNRIHFIPHQFTTDNYRAVFAKEGYRWGAVNTVLRTVLGVITMYVNGGLIPTFIVYQKLGLVNNFLVYIIPGAASAFNMLVIRNFMNGIPDSLEESAQIDGAGYFKIFYSIISPLCKPVYATIALFVAVYQWNSWFDAMLYNKMHDELTVLQYELMKQLETAMKSAGSVEGLKYGGSTITPTSIRAAATICTMLPILFIYPFLQRYFVTGLTIGGVKE